MKHAKHQARILALQGLYQLDIQQMPSDTSIQQVIDPLTKETEFAEKAIRYAMTLTRGAWINQERFDEVIAGVSDHWKISRMAVVDRNILRMALYELTEQPDIPPRVTIDEAIEIGREFGSAETPQFINGVLDAIWKKHPDIKTVKFDGNKLNKTPQDKTEENNGAV